MPRAHDLLARHLALRERAATVGAGVVDGVAPIGGDGVVRAPSDGVSAAALVLLALVIVIAAAWAALVTLFLPPLTLGWREFYEAMIRRWVRNVAVLGVGTVLVFVLWLLVLALGCRFSGLAARRADSRGLLGTESTPPIADPVDTVRTPGQDSRRP